MIELNRHIEILLLGSDCVIVPDLGGFVTHHIDARYDEEDYMFIPPARTLGFNPQLTMNDSLLAQSYVEAYDISYPEAVRRIESEVAELKQELQNEGVYEMNGIGELSLNEDGHIVFNPCEAGILTPALYGLGTFEMHKLVKATEKSRAAEFTAKALATEAASTAHVADGQTEDTEEPMEEKERAIVIKMSWLRNAVAIAAAIVAFFLITPPVANSDSSDSQVTISSVELLPMPKKEAPAKANVEKVAETTMAAEVTEAPKEEAPKAVEETPKVTEETPKAVEEAPKATEEVKPATPTKCYCIVLASQVSERNAEIFVKQLQARGHQDTRISVNHHTRRVVYGNYATQSQAYNALAKLRATSSDFAEAWVYEMKD